MLFLVVVIAGAHGLWLLPAILSLVGGSKQSLESAASVILGNLHEKGLQLARELDAIIWNYMELYYGIMWNSVKNMMNYIGIILYYIILTYLNKVGLRLVHLDILKSKELFRGSSCRITALGFQ